ncbi:serine/threonine-protein kinase Sgk2 [Cordyceps fumosorosea ARSEF 2679]|uniref:non-specific serine/threonine protein kinase n=1 Tax=Cordyceps fumosorosea (strain ARSEF 2679) TaxID=1081104 RepID=A0A167VRQ8_CORFA|nr:serine/threonine-protein kinase Sgk2 [Cordyceps fumosorosea ARSEF 2679]OAA62914.1 serine/threonine-protein kinase Sgk2 [Cordyceps fumosorosea ARSEF 2679]
MSLTEEQLKVIADYPLDDSLSRFSDKLCHLDGSKDTWRSDIATVLSILVGSSAAFNLHLSDGNSNVAGRLIPIPQKVRGGSLEYDHFRPLANAVATDSPDTDIWTAIINLIDAVNPSTPPPTSIIPTGRGTPVKTSSSRLEDSETREIVERELFYEIRDCTHRGVPRFFEKHFDKANWTKSQENSLKLMLTDHDGTQWKDFPADPLETPVWNWLRGLEKKALAGAQYILYTNKSATEFKERKGQMDIFFQRPKRTEGRFEYKHVLVAGEHKRSYATTDFKACMLQITRHVRSIFADQPMRRFVHAFTIRATTMELWIYDRSGAYSSGEFNIHHEPEKLARALVAYATMDDAAMGLDMSIEWKNSHRYITVEDGNGYDKRVELNGLLVRQRAVVCRGTACFLTRQGVAKFSWRSDKRQPPEVEHLKLAQEKGVEGVATLVGHREITSIAALRAGLVFSSYTRHAFRATAHERSGGYNRLQGSESSGSSRKRKSSDNPRPRTTRQSNSQKSTPRQAYDQSSGDEASGEAKSSIYTPNREDPYENRILSCLVISPAGRVLSDFSTIRELLEALHDAIRAHRSLYLKGGILHRDISSNNIIIPSPGKADGFKGMLIDLDLAKKRDSGPSGARHRTGTMQFMAIEVLRGLDHTYRHDLESFFYVLLWMCARCAWDEMKRFCGEGETAPEESLLRKWEIGRFKDIADAKEGHMTVNSLERIMNEFPVSLNIAKPLCLRIRSILFGDTARLMFGTPDGDPGRLYDRIIAAFGETIDDC